jgi:hypothetical protein
MSEGGTDGWITIPAAARLLGLQAHTIRRLIGSGELRPEYGAGQYERSKARLALGMSLFRASEHQGADARVRGRQPARRTALPARNSRARRGHRCVDRLLGGESSGGCLLPFKDGTSNP